MRTAPVLLAIATYVLAASAVSAETVDVKYRGPVDLKPFDCQSISRSSFINRVCYDPRNQYLVIQLKDTYYHYCELPKVTLDALMSASSMGRYFNANIKGSGKDGPYDCRTHKVPSY
ncbi:KTSC domain-containing protein [Bradyrhizobium canariense]|uniref:KTSC domain-containing protein n=1 Tax=Bradyrhizobium canariense TaxID=255045 RepID=A0A1X3G706_9BRAD|nr:KTSC domain-containing protein [Bradyrhizobium canariense]OSI74945.1 KTSC domain-containing protein [Bradyrhizobium canariense]OSI79821.1 KTSC domain-containing protein [Bradyrhizobium canariense]OSI83441.1 KTSC domain-containing protein [Bradyrhizobium canariense]OSI96838.1 KTSC domain-containing protein [Bradyrhizobium canariense]OSI98453.1 KTSC domain-containing protein [Bradyrhizobium canariense]